MIIPEKEIERIMYSQEFQDVFENGLDVYDHDIVIRQLSMGSYGKADLVGLKFYTNDSGVLEMIDVTIYELKKEFVSYKELCQVQKYLYALSKLLWEDSRYKGIDINFSTVLIGHNFDVKSVEFMATAAELRIRLFIYDSTHKGIIFKRIHTHDYKPDSYEKTWINGFNQMNLLKLFRGEQDAMYDPSLDKAWFKNK